MLLVLTMPQLLLVKPANTCLYVRYCVPACFCVRACVCVILCVRDSVCLRVSVYVPVCVRGACVRVSVQYVS